MYHSIFLLNNKLHFTGKSRFGCLKMKNECFWSGNTWSSWASYLTDANRPQVTSLSSRITRQYSQNCSLCTNQCFRRQVNLSFSENLKTLASKLSLWSIFSISKCREVKKSYFRFQIRARVGLCRQGLHDNIPINVHFLHIEALEDRSTSHLVKEWSL